LVIATYISSYFNVMINETDKDGFNRSGFRLLTDYETGLQYLYKGGTIIPRLDVNGKQKKILKEK